MPDPVTFNIPPTYSFPDIPIPPETINAPDVVDVLAVELVKMKLP